MVSLQKIVKDSKSLKETQEKLDFLEKSYAEYQIECLDAERRFTFEDYLEDKAYWESLTTDDRRIVNAEADESRKAEDQAEAYIIELIEHLKFIEDNKARATNTRADVSLSAFRDEYCHDMAGELASSTIRMRRETFNTLIAAIGDINLSELRPKQARSFINAKRKGGESIVYANSLLRALKPIFNIAVQWDYLEKNPFDDIKKVKEPKGGKPQHLTPEQLALVIAQIPDTQREYSDIFLFLAHTGIRRDELINLKWSDVHEDKREIDIIKTKTKEARTVVLTDTALEILARRRMVADGSIVFHLNGHTRGADHVTNVFKKYTRAAGMDENINLHSLRHSSVTAMINAGVPITDIQEQHGHRNVEVTMGYAHSTTASRHKSIIRALEIFPASPLSPLPASEGKVLTYVHQ